MSGETVAIVAGAGRGERIGRKEGKQFLELDGVPVLARSLLNIEAVRDIGEIILVVNAVDAERAREDIVDRYGLEKISAVVEGGEWRQGSVFKALRVLGSGVETVLVHDGARPLATPALFADSIKALRGCEGVITAIPLVDTVKEVEGGWVIRTPERRRLWAIQTPQCFRSSALLDAHERAYREGVWATDDAALLERYGYRIRVVEGELTNIKITYPHDLILAEALLEKGGLEIAVPGGFGV
ncbi:MAG: 2-C-methyl-D-erythritol 4-phosphate cytidylyltransferase [Actinomycetota bacterium]|nr:2-C-methyl-D-erythritol 4-phosphate cytidylyltransferase [Actinomycetota bacterium]